MNFPKVLLSNEAQIIVLTSVKTWGLFHEGVSFQNTNFWKYLVIRDKQVEVFVEKGLNSSI